MGISQGTGDLFPDDSDNSTGQSEIAGTSMDDEENVGIHRLLLDALRSLEIFFRISIHF